MLRNRLVLKIVLLALFAVHVRGFDCAEATPETPAPMYPSPMATALDTPQAPTPMYPSPMATALDTPQAPAPICPPPMGTPLDTPQVPTPPDPSQISAPPGGCEFNTNYPCPSESERVPLDPSTVSQDLNLPQSPDECVTCGPGTYPGEVIPYYEVTCAATGIQQGMISFSLFNGNGWESTWLGISPLGTFCYHVVPVRCANKCFGDKYWKWCMSDCFNSWGCGWIYQHIYP